MRVVIVLRSGVKRSCPEVEVSARASWLPRGRALIWLMALDVVELERIAGPDADFTLTDRSLQVFEEEFRGGG